MANINNFKGYIYAYYYSCPDFLLKEVKSESFISLLTDEFISQLAWGFPALKTILLERGATAFKQKLSKELEFKAFAHSFYSKGFTVHKSRLYLKFNPEKGYILPDSSKPLYVEEGDFKGGETYARFDNDKGWFFGVDEKEVIAIPHLWRYAKRSDMEQALAEQGLEDHSTHILYGEGLSVIDSKTVPIRELLLALLPG